MALVRAPLGAFAHISKHLVAKLLEFFARACDVACISLLQSPDVLHEALAISIDHGRDQNLPVRRKAEGMTRIVEQRLSDRLRRSMFGEKRQCQLDDEPPDFFNARLELRKL